jgi:hypothetical protein
MGILLGLIEMNSVDGLEVFDTTALVVNCRVPSDSLAARLSLRQKRWAGVCCERSSPVAMKPAFILATVLAAVPFPAHAQQNLVPNWDFSDPTPLKGFRFQFDFQDWYKKNASYVKETTIGGKKCALIDLPPGVAGNEGGKIETALVPCEPGATYHAEVEHYLPTLAAKFHLEAYAVDPRDNALREAQEAKGVRLTIQRIAPMNGQPALVMIWRGQLPDPIGGAQWGKVQREMTIPFEWPIANGKYKVKPAFLTLKAYTFGATMAAGKSYFTNFKIHRVPTQGSPPIAGGVSATYGNSTGQKGLDREIPLPPKTGGRDREQPIPRTGKP